MKFATSTTSNPSRWSTRAAADSPYRTAYTRAARGTGMLQYAPPADIVARTIVSAVESARPRKRYLVGADAVGGFDADATATSLMGDSLYANPMLLGYAWQRGWVPLAHASLMRAIELNDVAIDNNKAAFEWGRRAAHDPASVQQRVSPGQVIEFKRRETVDTLVARRVEFLTDYQNAAYAERYRAPRENPARVVVEIRITRVLGNV